MSEGIPASWLLASMRLSRLAETLADGIKAFVALYYENYIDATQVDADTLALLETLVDESLAGIDVRELVEAAEQEINSDGGITGADGTKHPVRTYEKEGEY